MHSFRALPAPLLALLASATASLAFALDAQDWPAGFLVEHTAPVYCARPSQANDRIAVHYRGTLSSTGVEFDESYDRGSPFTFTLGAGQVIKGWDMGLLDMCPGEKRKLTVPPELGYGQLGAGPIPPSATLVFDTELVDIVGVNQEDFYLPSASAGASSTSSEPTFGIATAPPTPPTSPTPPTPPIEDEAEDEDENKDELVATPLEPEPEDASPERPPEKQAECHLLGPYALIVQGALGGFALLTLVWKRYRETPKRPWKIFFFDVSKQVVGSMLTHVLNVGMSMIASVDLTNQAQKVAASGKANDEQGHSPNPCSFYLLNLGIDTTLGIPVLWLALKVLHALFLRTSLAKPAESIKSGNYGQPPRAAWWLKQSLIYFIALVIMKLFVFLLFSVFPWLPWVGDWALRWTKGNEQLEVAFAMFIFPLAMNAVQYWVIDNFIMDKKKSGEGYEQVHQGDDEDDHMGDGSMTEVEEEVAGKDAVDEAPLKEANPTPIPEYSEEMQRSHGEGSRVPTPKMVDEQVDVTR